MLLLRIGVARAGINKMFGSGHFKPIKVGNFAVLGLLGLKLKIIIYCTRLF